MSGQELPPADFQMYHAFLLKHSGLDLKPSQTYLIVSRLTPMAKRMGVEGGLAGITAAVRRGPEPRLKKAIVEAMTTNETSFFRDTKPFALLSELVPEIIARGRPDRTIRIWSAACSSGQEAYSIAMTLGDILPRHPGWRVRITGTDIDEEIMDKAREGVYTQFEVQRGLTIQRLMANFTQEKTAWRVKPELSRMAEFKKANLLEDLGHLGAFDIVFCRNVLIYFNGETKRAVLAKVAGRIAPGGVLFLGAAESIIGHSDAFEPLPGQHAILRLKG